MSYFVNGRKREAYYLSNEGGMLKIGEKVPDDALRTPGMFIIESKPDPVWLMYQDHGNGD